MSTPLPRLEPAPPALPDLAESYDSYFRSGLYHTRYPRPNRRTLRIVRRYLREGGSLLDFGAGEGRYAFAVAGQDRARVLAIDISPVARAMLEAEAARRGLSSRIEVADVSDAAYRRDALGSRRFDVALLGFGVLGHVAGRAARIDILRQLRSTLTPNGRLVMGVPNARRRFRAEQAASPAAIADGELEPGDILYSRDSENGRISLFYHLFRDGEIRSDLKDAGFETETLTSESLFPERAVTHSRALGGLDDALCELLPADWGYGYLAVGKPL